MTAARFKVVFAGPLVSFQDAGRIGHLRYGVSNSGPMDRFGFAAAFAMLGKDQTGTCIEVSLGGLVLECIEGDTTVAVAGGGFSIGIGGDTSQGWRVQTIQQGDRITLRAGAWGSWAYLAFSGDLVVEDWLGATTTHSMSRFGGGALRTGMEIALANASSSPNRDAHHPCPKIAQPVDEIRVVIGPQDQHFEPQAIEAFLGTKFSLTDAFDRMGVRLDGPILALKDALSIPSEPIIRGSVQVSGDGVPTVLLSDHQTTGGYPKIATLISCDMDRFSQLRAGDAVRFVAITAEDALLACRAHQNTCMDQLNAFMKPPTTLGEKLLSQNLIGGVVSAGSQD